MPRVIGTLLIRDEEDIVLECLEHHVNNGIDGFVVTDNGSVDNSRAIIQSHKSVLQFIDEPEHTFKQDVWVTRMAHAAVDHKADFVVHIDCDEFWYGLNKLSTIDRKINEIRVNTLYNHVVTRTPINTANIRNRYPYYTKVETRGKTIHRATKDVKVSLGNHRIKLPHHKRLQDHELFHIHHYPLRSLSQFEKKCRNAGSLAESKNCNPKSPWIKLWNLYLNNQITDSYSQHLYSEEDLIRSLSAGKLHRLGDVNGA